MTYYYLEEIKYNIIIVKTEVILLLIIFIIPNKY